MTIGEPENVVGTAGNYFNATLSSESQTERTIKETVEEFDDEGRLKKRTITETTEDDRYPCYQQPYIWNTSSVSDTVLGAQH